VRRIAGGDEANRRQIECRAQQLLVMRRTRWGRNFNASDASRLYAALAQTQLDADASDERLEVPLLFGGRAPVTLVTWPGGHPFRSGDPLHTGAGLVVAAPGVSGHGCSHWTRPSSNLTRRRMYAPGLE
jgi:hypothetical protein